MNVLVTGGCGAIGSNLVRRFVADGNQVTVLDDLSSGHAWLLDGLDVRVVAGSICDPRALGNAFADNPQVVFHLAAHFANQNSLERPMRDLQTNVEGTLRLLQACVAEGVQRFVYTAAGCSGDTASLPLREGAVHLRHSTPYQASKQAAESYCWVWAHAHGLPVTVARLFNSYGPGEVPGPYRNVLPNWIWSAMQGKPLIVTGTGSETRDWVFVDDLVQGLAACAGADAARGVAVNLGSGREVEVLTLLEEVRRHFPRTEIEFWPRRGWDHKLRMVADVSLARKALGWSFTTSLEDGVAATVQWFADNRREIERSAR